MSKIEWKSAAQNTGVANVAGGQIVLYESYGGNEYQGTTAMCASMVFIPDPRIALAGQIAAGMIASEILMPNVQEFATRAFEIADEILKQASKSEAGNG